MNHAPDPPIRIELMTSPVATMMPSKVAKSKTSSRIVRKWIHDICTVLSMDCATVVSVLRMDWRMVFLIYFINISFGYEISRKKGDLSLE